MTTRRQQNKNCLMGTAFSEHFTLASDQCVQFLPTQLEMDWSHKVQASRHHYTTILNAEPRGKGKEYEQGTHDTAIWKQTSKRRDTIWVLTQSLTLPLVVSIFFGVCFQFVAPRVSRSFHFPFSLFVPI